jgi:hypothetical protein
MTLRWFAARTEGAPGSLSGAAAHWLASVPTDEPVAQLTAAGGVALDAAIAAGATRDAALDLLAADALITLALLAAAEHDPMALGSHAARVRQAVTPA